jgi:hypothetical protein
MDDSWGATAMSRADAGEAAGLGLGNGAEVAPSQRKTAPTGVTRTPDFGFLSKRVTTIHERSGVNRTIVPS